MVAAVSLFEVTGNERLAISQEGLRTLLGQLEAELYKSDVYQRALAGLQKQGDGTEGAQSLLKAVGKEAIRLTLRQLMKQYQLSPKLRPSQSSQTISNRPALTLATVESSSVEQTHPSPLPSKASVEHPPTPLSAPISAPINVRKEVDQIHPSVNTASRESRIIPQTHNKRGLRKDNAPDPVTQKRTTILRQIGAELEQSRRSQAVSLEQLHSQTWVPIHLIRALETGAVDQLPEDVYIRGFVRRIGDALGLDGKTLANSLAVLDSGHTVIPSWQQRSPEPPTLRPVHLYLSYAALMAGALGGLAWMSHQPAAGEVSDQHLSESSGSPSVSQAASRNTATSTKPSSIQQSTGGIAVPETTPPESSQQ